MINKTKIVDIRGNMVTMMSIMLYETDLDLVAKCLESRVQQAPAFFMNTPVVVDFSQIPIDLGFDFNTLFKLVRQQKLLPVAVRGVPEQLKQRMQQAGVPVVEPASGDKEPRHKRSKSGKTIIVEHPVTAGQECFAQDGDLVILAGSDAASELVADGNIHCYGEMRGRVLCGAHGDADARIFCTALRADLVSVAGRSKSLDVLPGNLRERPVQIRLQDEEIVIEPLEAVVPTSL